MKFYVTSNSELELNCSWEFTVVASEDYMKCEQILKHFCPRGETE